MQPLYHFKRTNGPRFRCGTVQVVFWWPIPNENEHVKITHQTSLSESPDLEEKSGLRQSYEHRLVSTEDYDQWHSSNLNALASYPQARRILGVWIDMNTAPGRSLALIIRLTGFEFRRQRNIIQLNVVQSVFLAQMYLI